MTKTSNVSKLKGLLYWSLVRNKGTVILCIVIQFFMAVALVFGYSLLLADTGSSFKDYLGSGAITMGMISIGCTMSSQVVASAKQDGVITYLRTLPVKRAYILLVDMGIWCLSALLGTLLPFILVWLKFGLVPHLTWSLVFIPPLSLLCMLSIGFAVAHWCQPNVMNLITQLILMVGLLFSPIMYSADRLPDLIVGIYRFLPFVAVGDLMRDSVFGGQKPDLLCCLIISFWLGLCFFLSLKKLKQRD